MLNKLVKYKLMTARGFPLAMHEVDQLGGRGEGLKAITRNATMSPLNATLTTIDHH